MAPTFSCRAIAHNARSLVPAYASRIKNTLRPTS